MYNYIGEICAVFCLRLKNDIKYGRDVMKLGIVRHRPNFITP